ncbi:MAG: HAD-IIA family hydrolase [Clostridia bacterium]|nr:HAD-IIA family hydrolase [Clostridia bacterium]
MKLSDKKLFLLDMDGTIYLDSTLFDGTLDFLSKVRSNGGRYLFVTNNSSKSTEKYVEKLDRIGIDACDDDFLTSTDATISYILANHPDKKFYSFGTESFTKQLSEAGIAVTTEPEDDIDGLVISNDQELTFKKLDDASKLLTERDIVYIATNPDWVCPTAYGYVPDCGCFCDILKRATGKSPIFIGKPEPEMLLSALGKFGYEKDEAVMIGDRLYTDIASGVNAGIDTVFVLSGEGTLQDLEKSSIKPTYVLTSIKDLYEILKNNK